MLSLLVAALTVTLCIPSTKGAPVTVGPCPVGSSTPTPTVPTPRPTLAPTPVPTPVPTPPPSSVYIPTPPFPAGPFNTAVVASPTIDTQSSTYIHAALAGNNTLGKIQVTTRSLSLGPTDDGVPIYTAHNSDPAYTIHCMYYTNCPIEGQVVHIPKGAIPGGNLGYTMFTDDGSHDQHMAIRNVDSQVETDTWLTPLPNGIGGTLSVGYGGSFPFNSGGVGHGGATASGFALSQGRIRALDLEAGYIPYAVFLVTPCENGVVAPATGGDSGSVAGCPPMGAHVWLDSSASDIANSGASPYFQVIMRALHEYGGYIGDRCTSCSLTISVETGIGYQAMGLPNPWSTILQSFPNETPSGSAGEYHLVVSPGNIVLQDHLHVIK